MADDDKIAQFISITSSTPQEAQTFLAQAANDVEAAIGLFFAASDDPMDDPVPSDGEYADQDDQEDEDEPISTPAASASPRSTTSSSSNSGAARGTTLGGGPAEALPQGWGRPSVGGTGARVGRVGQWGGSGASGGSAGTSSGSGPRIATLGSINSGGGGAPAARGGGGDDDDDDDDGEEWYAGGERSGINVENPDRAPPGQGRGVVKDILKKAKEAGPAPSAGGPSGSGSSTPTWGRGNTLGSDSTPSTSIPDPASRNTGNEGEQEEDEDEETAIRHLTFWRDGFSIEDGELRRYDEPGNSLLLQAINQGRAPPSLLNVRVNQPVEVRVAKRLNEDWQPAPPKPKGPFEGSGNRLGAPTPSSLPSSSSTSTSQLPGSFPTSSTTSTSSSSPSSTAAAPAASSSASDSAPRFSVDTTEPTTSLQIRLGDGTRIVAKVNLTHTVGDIRGFIEAARPSSSRPYALQLTFPNRDLTDVTQTIKEAKLENAVIVQRWT